MPGGAPTSLRAGPALRWLGTLSARIAVYILLGATLLGVVGTLLTGSEPGFLLGFLIIVGSVVAAAGVRRGSLYLLIPLPTLAFFIGAVLTGAVHDRGIDTSTTELGVNFLQWIADVFVAMCAATILVLVIAGGRWLLSKQLVTGQFPMSASRGNTGRRPGARPAPGSRAGGGKPSREDRAEWGTTPSWTDRDLPGGSRANRDQRDNRDPRGSRGVPPDRGPRGLRDQRDASNRRGAGNQRDGRNQRDDRDIWGPRDQRDTRDPRDDRPRPTY